MFVNLMITKVRIDGLLCKILLSSLPFLNVMIVNLRSFRLRLRFRKAKYIRFLSGLRRKPPRGLDQLAERMDKEVWKEVDCTSCANCCITMSPTYTQRDIKRISSFLGMTSKDFKTKWLFRDKEGDWLNKSAPCQFLDPETNHCNIYAVRPADCVGFPHFTKKKMIEYMHVHIQNVESCPATFKMVERMMMHLHKKK
jgi:Fe-S-cluster containining protein